jgi:tetrahydromethanopterin S-methyltransferase subunit B
MEKLIEDFIIGIGISASLAVMIAIVAGIHRYRKNRKKQDKA